MSVCGSGVCAKFARTCRRLGPRNDGALCESTNVLQVAIILGGSNHFREAARVKKMFWPFSRFGLLHLLLLYNPTQTHAIGACPNRRCRGSRDRPGGPRIPMLRLRVGSMGRDAAISELAVRTWRWDGLHDEQVHWNCRGKHFHCCSPARVMYPRGSLQHDACDRWPGRVESTVLNPTGAAHMRHGHGTPLRTGAGVHRTAELRAGASVGRQGALLCRF